MFTFLFPFIEKIPFANNKCNSLNSEGSSSDLMTLIICMSFIPDGQLCTHFDFFCDILDGL